MLGVVFMGIAGSLNAAPGIEGAVNADLLNVRLKSDLKSPVVVKLKQGDKVTIRRIVGNWAEIDAPAKTQAYVSGVYVRDGKVLADIAVRSKCAQNAPVITQLSKGDTVKVLGDAGYGWLKVEVPENIRFYTVKYYLDFVMDPDKLEPENSAATDAEQASGTEAEKNAGTKAAPAATEKPAETAEPAATEKPAEAKAAPAVTEKPAETAKPAATEKPAETAKPAATEKPAETAKPAATEKPAEEKAAPAVTEKPAEVKAAVDKESALKTQAEALQVLGIDPGKPEGEKKYSGVLVRVAGSSYRATDFALTGDTANLCFVCAASPDELLPLVNKKVSLTGMQYRVPGWTLPVLRLESIKAE